MKTPIPTNSNPITENELIQLTDSCSQNMKKVVNALETLDEYVEHGPISSPISIAIFKLAKKLLKRHEHYEQIVIALLSFCLSACTYIGINTSPQHADVYIDGEYIGESPTTTSVSSFTHSLHVRVEKYGYESQEMVVTPFISKTATIGFSSAYSYGSPYGVYGSGIEESESVNWPPQILFQLEKTSK